MMVGTVVGHVWSTKKDPTLAGLRFLVVQPFTLGAPTAETVVAVDPLGAGIGERVLVVFGRAARHVIGRGQDIGFQTAVSAIIDKMELEDGRTIGPVAGEDAPAAARSSSAAAAPRTATASAPPIHSAILPPTAVTEPRRPRLT
jgi:ethanolamine utilization protein EutN